MIDIVSTTDGGQNVWTIFELNMFTSSHDEQEKCYLDGISHRAYVCLSVCDYLLKPRLAPEQLLTRPHCTSAQTKNMNNAQSISHMDFIRRKSSLRARSRQLTPLHAYAPQSRALIPYDPILCTAQVCTVLRTV